MLLEVLPTKERGWDIPARAVRCASRDVLLGENVLVAKLLIGDDVVWVVHETASLPSRTVELIVAETSGYCMI